MSVNDIMNYVNKTPGNTNPAVVKSMVENEKEKSVYASVEELKKSGSVGHSEIEKIVVPSDGAPYNGELVGLTVTDHCKGRRCLKTEMERPTDLNVGTLLCNLTDWRVKYETVNGVTNLPVLTVSGDMLCALCPVFFGGLSEYDCLIYAYEETHDTLGIGITLKKGWFAVNSATFAMKAVDLSVTPCFDFFFHYKYEEQAYEYYSTPLEAIEFVVEEKNISNDEETGDKAVCLTDIQNLNPQSIIETHRLYLWCTILHSHGKLIVIGDQDLRTVTIEIETIHPIDPKFLPDKVKPKVIDLTKYNAGDGMSLNEKVLERFSLGGGIVSMPHTDGTRAFWRDISAGGNIRILIDAGSKIVTNINSNTFEANMYLEAIEVSFLILAGTASRVTVLFGNFTEMEITVVVEPVSMPG